MTKSIRSKLASLLGIALVATSLALAATTGTAAADDVSGTAAGLPGLSLAGSQVLGTPPCSGTGTPAGASDNCDVNPILPTVPLVDVGVAAQDVRADTNGHVGACAGLIGEGGRIEIGDDFGCTDVPAPGGAQGLQVLSALPGAAAVLGLDAAYAECTASATGVSGGAAVVRGLTILGTNVGDILDSPPNTVINLAVATIRINTQEAIPNGIRVTALSVDVLGLPGAAPLLNLTVGRVECRVDAINNDSASGTFDRSGDVVTTDGNPVGTSVQPGTRNALAVTFNPGGDRNNVTGTIRLGPGVTIDRERVNNPATRTSPFNDAGPFQAVGVSDGLPDNCTYIDSATDPRIDCAFGNLVGGTRPTVTIPVVIADNAPNPIEATVQMRAATTNPVSNIFIGQGPAANGGRGPVFGGGLLPANIPADRVGLIQAPLGVAEARVEGVAGGTANIDPLPLPTTTIPGQLYLDLPDYVTAASYGNTICDVLTEPVSVTEHLRPETYPELPDAGYTRFNCGQVQKLQTAARNIQVTIAPGTPGTNPAGDPPVGRAVVVRRNNVAGNNTTFTVANANPTFTPPFMQENSYYANLFIRVVGNVVNPPGEDDPDITLDKSVNSLPEPGGDFTYTLTVRNLDNEAATITAISDTITSGADNGQVINLNGVGTCDTGEVLDPAGDPQGDDVYTCTFTRNLTGPTGTSESDTATVTARDNDGDNNTDTATDNALAVIGNEHRLGVTKTAVNDELPAPGGVFTYNVTVTNVDDQFDGNITLTSLVDRITGQADVNLAGDADCKVGTVLAEGASCTFQFTDEFTGAAGAQQTDTVTARGTAPDGFPAEGSDEETVFIISSAPGLIVTKTADPESLPEPGGTFTFKVSVQNTLTQPVTLTKLSDTIELSGDDKVVNLDGVGTCKVGGVIQPGANNAYSCSFTTVFEGNANDTQTDVVTATATAGGQTYQDTDAETVKLTDVLPRIRVDETVEPPSRKTPGGDFTWKVTVTNESKASSDPVQITSLRNELLLDLEKDPNCKQLLGTVLDVGESASCTFVTKVEGPDGKVGTDIVVVTAKDDEGNSVSDLGNAAVSLTAGDPPVVPPTTKSTIPITGANSRTTAAAAMLFAGLGLVLTGGGMRQAPELAIEGQRRRRRR